MKKFSKKGYSMIVLVIAIVVILILSTVSISALQNSKERTKMLNFIFDMNAMEDKVKSYYIDKGTLPTDTEVPINMNDFGTLLGTEDFNQFKSQLSNYDNEKYYYIDLTQISGISLRDSERGYIVNEGSLKVYVRNGVEYQSEGNSIPIKYFTLTSDLVNGQGHYVSQEEEIVIVGNPISWVSSAKLRVVLPKRNLNTDWNNWEFKWDFGPKPLEHFRNITSDGDRRIFNYGDALTVKSNGIYSIYVKSPDEKETVLNVHVTKIDDIPPKYKVAENGDKTVLVASDDETGVRAIMYKELSAFEKNVEDAGVSSGDAYKNAVEYYLMDGKGKDLLYELENEISDYVIQMKNLLILKKQEETEYNRWIAENPVDGIFITTEDVNRVNVAHDIASREFEQQITELNKKYPYLADIHGTTKEARLVVYIEDYSGNATVIGNQQQISTWFLANSYNISLKPFDELENV